MTTRRWPLCAVCLIAALAVASSHDSIAGMNKWTSTGPNGGMLMNFFFHPTKKNLVFASGWGSASSLYRSRDGGRSWERAIEGVVFAMIHPSEPDVIVGGWGSIYRSTDAGDSWQLLADLPFGENTSDMELDPKNPSVLYALTDSSKVYKSTDGGRTWADRSKGLPDGCLYGSMEVDPTNGNIVYVNLSNGEVYKTKNGAASWKEASTGLALDQPSTCALAIDPKDPSVLYAGGRPIFKTVNGGKQWTRISDRGCWTIAVDPNNVQDVYCAGGGVARSTDGGSTWTSFELDTEHFLGVAVHPASSKIILAGGYGQGIYRSQDAGKTWSSQNSGLDAVDVAGLSAQSSPNGRLFLTTTPPFESRNKGKTWQIMEMALAPHSNWIVHDILVHPSRPDLVVAGVYIPGPVLVSEDGMKTWEHKSPYRDVTRIALVPTDQRTIYAAPVQSGEHLYVGMATSTDLGETWKTINRGFTPEYVVAIAVDPRSASRILIGTFSGKVYWSSNGGEKWNRSSIQMEDGSVMVFAFDPFDSKKIWLASSSGIFTSTDSGKTWNQVLPGGSDFIAIDPVEGTTILAGSRGGHGIILSMDDGRNWSAFDATGLPLCTPLSFMFSPWDSDTVFMGTSRGVFSYTKKVTPGHPKIDQLIPAAGKVGDAVTINGSGFGPSQGSSTVNFGSVAAGTASSWSDSSLTVNVPSGARTGPVAVTVASRTSNTYQFVVLPSTGNIEPSSGPASGGTRVAILAPEGLSGSEFNVLFGSSLATELGFQSPNIILCTTPPGTGAVEVKVVLPLTSTTVGTFTYQ